jgi:GntR family transcriptional regulator
MALIRRTRWRRLPRVCWGLGDGDAIRHSTSRNGIGSLCYFVRTSLVPPPPVNTKSGPRFAYVELREHLRAQILEGVYRPGERLATEHELATLTQLSRHTVRSALEELRLEGLITRVPGKGTFVSSSPPSGPRVRVIGGSAAVFGFGLTGQVRVVEGLHQLGADLTTPDRTAAEELDCDVSELWRLSFVRLIGKSPMGVWLIWLPKSVVSEVEPFLMEVEQEPDASVMRIISRHADREARRATQLMTAESADEKLAEQLYLEVGAPLLTAQRTYFDAHEAPFEHVLVRYVPKLYANRLELLGGNAAR